MSTLRVFILFVVFAASASAKNVSITVAANIQDTAVAYVGERQSILAECFAMSEYTYHDSSNFRAFQENRKGGFWYDIEFTPKRTGVFRDTIIAHWDWGLSRCGDPRDDRDTIYVEGIASDTAAAVESVQPMHASLNFANGLLGIRSPGAHGLCRLAIVDVVGRSVFLADLFVEDFASVRLPAKIPAGTYFVEISGVAPIIGHFALTR